MSKIDESCVVEGTTIGDVANGAVLHPTSLEIKSVDADQAWRLLPPHASKCEDPWHRFVRTTLFPLLVTRPRAILFIWIVMFSLSAAFGPAFFDLTRSNFDLPHNTPSYVATQAYARAYPNANGWPPVFVVQSAAPGSSIIQGLEGVTTQRVASALANFSRSSAALGAIERVSGFWELQSIPSLALLASAAVSPDNTTLLSTVVFTAGASQSSINNAVVALLPFVSGLSENGVTVAATGLFALFSEMTAATKDSFAAIDATVLPVATIILGWRLRSYRHMAVSFAALGCTLLLAFAIMVPIAGVVDINPFAPSIMLSLGIAVTFDYSLFLLMRFREERILACRDKENAVFHALSEAGHVIFLSGSTLIATFLLLVFFPANFLVSVGWACAVVVLAGMITNLTLTPALLLAFDCLSFFDLFPSRKSCCCRVPTEDAAVTARNLATATAAAAAASLESPQRRHHCLPARPLLTLARTVTSPRARWIVIIGTALITIPFAIAFQSLQPSSDDYLIYLLGSRSVNALTRMKAAFPEGELDPYYVLVDAGMPHKTMTQEYFNAEAVIVSRLLATQTNFLTNASVTALSYFRGAPVTFTDASNMLLVSESNVSFYDGSPRAVAYRALAGTLPSDSGAASVVRLVTTTSPRSLAIVAFIRSVRTLSDAMAAAPPPPSNELRVSTYLVGGITADIDVQDALYALVPLEIGVVIALVLFVIGASFRSVSLSVRLVATIFISLIWTFGLMVLVYQPGPAQDSFKVLTPSLSNSKGLYWIIPVLSFSVLVGLALDYDIFLMSRVADFRERGWSDRASMCLAVEKTGGIITTAGLIMIVSFVGMLIPQTIVLNQYGFALLVG
jgi:uncharacterized membrane protein YdfJ with MMPL/SSD domain